MIRNRGKTPFLLAFCAGLFSLFTLGACGQAGPAVVAPEKPTSPLQISLQPLEAVAPGKIVTFEAKVSSLSPFADVVLQVELPTPLRLVSGPQRWQGALVPGIPQGITFTVYLPTEGSHRIRATATVQGGNSTIGSEAVYVVGGEQSDTSSGVKMTPRIAPPDSDGRPVVEYPLK